MPGAAWEGPSLNPEQARAVPALGQGRLRLQWRELHWPQCYMAFLSPVVAGSSCGHGSCAALARKVISMSPNMADDWIS